MTPQERLAYLLETVETPTNQLVTLAVLRSALPPDAYALVLYTFSLASKPQSDTIAAVAEAKEMEGVFIALASTDGITLSPPDRQAAIDRLADVGLWPDAVRDAVKALGVTHRPRWQSEGMASEPTLDQIRKQMAIDNTRAAMAAILQPVAAKSTAVNAWLDGLDTTNKTAEEVEAYVAKLLASHDGNPA